MGDDWNDDGAVTTNQASLNATDLQEVKLFGKWSCDEVNISDMSLQVHQTHDFNIL